MEIETNIDLTKFNEFDKIVIDHEWDLQGRAADGWRLIAIGTDRPTPNSDGSFTDNFVAIVGREKSED